MSLRIYEEQKGYLHETRPYNYMPEDVLYRLPWAMGEPEPPLRVLYPIIYKTKDGREVFDPLTVYIGRTAGKKPFAYNPRYVVNPLILVVGTPGAGKSATLKTFIYNLLSNEVFMPEGRVPPVVVVDPEGEYAVIGKMIGQENMLHLKLGRRDYINIFDRPSKTINPFSWYTRMLAVIQKFLAISPAQAAQAYRALKRAIFEKAKEKGITQDPATWFKDDITLEEVYDWLENQVKTLENKKKMTPGERMFYRGANTLLTRMDSWMFPPNDAFSKRSTVPLNKLFNYKLVVLDARGLAKDLFGIFSYWIVYWSYGLMLEKGPLPEFGVRMVLVIDEAWALLRKSEKKEEENPLEALARRGRKYGILIIVATQTPEDVDEKMFSLFGTLVTGIIPSDKMVNKIVESRGMSKRFKAIIKSLPRGQLVWSINWSAKDFPMSRVPIIVNTDYPIKRLIQIS
jgi:hypothetical protein